MPDLNSSLNDAASLLIQIEPADISELEDLQYLLNTIAKEESCPEASREKIVRAVQQIREILGLDKSDPAKSEEVIETVGHLIEEAMNAMDEDGKKTADRKSTAKTFPDQPIVKTHKPDIEEKSQAEEGIMPSDTDPDLLAAFITESSELITNAEEALLSLETDPDDIDAVSTVFRAFHTIKGTSAFLELSFISELAHHSESFLSRIRDREIRYEGGYTDLALRAVDMLKELILSVQNISDGTPIFKPRGYNDLMRALADPEKAGVSPENPLSPQIDEVPAEDTSEPLHRIETGEPDETSTLEKEIIPLEEEIIPPEEEKSEQVKTAPPTVAQGVRLRQRTEGAKKIVESSVRVPVERLDRFIDMVGELVVAHSMVVQDEIVAGGSQHELLKKVTLTSKIVRELQNMSMSMRMIPLKATFQKMTRLVRDLARKAGKNVTFVAEGEDTEIDRNMVDIISDPLVHMIRNAVDHGIELPEIREQIGKPRYGTVKLSARHSAGNVVVKIRDDGSGLDRKAILNKAIESGIFSDRSDTRENAFSDRELFNLIFEPGFSTAKIVSEVSGRGVGMDVVKKNIEALRGQIEIQSSPGKGSVFKMSLPLTLAIIDGMVVRVGEERYVMPTISIVRSVQPVPGDISTILRKGEMLSLQGKLVPLFRLGELFQIGNSEKDPTRAIVMVVEDDGKQAGILIDELIGSQQIVIKTLGESLRNIPGISGSAIMPNGRVGLILDVGGLVSLANTGRHF